VAVLAQQVAAEPLAVFSVDLPSGFGLHTRDSGCSDGFD
jgi:hypothetical protein